MPDATEHIAMRTLLRVTSFTFIYDLMTFSVEGKPVIKLLIKQT